MTSLQHQLEKLKAPFIEEALKSKKVSLLFEAKNAEALDLEDVLNLTLEGLDELMKIDENFSKYRKLLFNKECINFNRAFCTNEVNEKLNITLLNYFVEASPYFPLKATQKTLEWLVRRYQIHHFNVDDWIMTILPFHDSNMFVNVLMILDLEKPTSKWHWLYGCAKHGVHLPRSVIVNHCKSNGGFLRSLFLSYTETYIKILGKESNIMESVITFRFEIALDIIKDSVNISQETVAVIVQFLITGIKSKCLPWEAKCYEYLPRLMYCVNLASDKVLLLCRLISRHHSEELIRSTIFCLNLMVGLSEYEIPKETFSKFTFSMQKLKEIEIILREFNVVGMLELLQDFDPSGSIRKMLQEKSIDVLKEKTETYTVPEEHGVPSNTDENIGLSDQQAPFNAEGFENLSIIHLISFLASKDNQARKCALKLILKKRHQLSEDGCASLLKKIFKRRQEISHSYEQIAYIFSKCFSTPLNERYKNCLTPLLDSLQKEEMTMENKCNLLKCFQMTDNDEVVNSLMMLANQTYSSHDAESDKEHFIVMKSILECLSSHINYSSQYDSLVIELLKMKDIELAKLAVESLKTCSSSFQDRDNDLLCGELLRFALQNKSLVTPRIFKKFTLRANCIRQELNLSDLRDVCGQKLKRIKLEEQKLDISKVQYILEVIKVPTEVEECVRMVEVLMKLISTFSNEGGYDFCLKLALNSLQEIVCSEVDVKELNIDVEILIQCLCCSKDVQTQQQVVILISAIASFLPEQILNNIVAVFSFLGNQFLISEDKYSFEILTSLINIVLMAIKDSSEPNKILLDLLRIFVDSRHHISQHRLKVIVDKLISMDVNEHLWKVVILTFQSCICKRETSTNEEEFKQLLAREHEIISSLVSHCSTETLLVLIYNLIVFIRKVGNGKKLEIIDQGLTKPHLRRLMSYHLSKVVLSLLGEKICVCSVDDENHLKKLIEEVIQYMVDITTKKRLTEVGKERFQSSLIKVVQDIFDKMSHFLPMSLFVEVVDNLLSTDLIEVKIVGLEILNVKLTSMEKSSNFQSNLSCSKLVGLLIDFINSVAGGQETKSDIYKKQLSLVNLKLMLKIYGAEKLEEFKDLCSPLMQCIKKDNPTALVVSALLCFSDYVVVMKHHLIPFIDQILQDMIILYNDDNFLTNQVSLNCINLFLKRLIQNLGQFFSSKLVDVLVVIGKSVENGVEVNKFQQVFQAISSGIETRVLIPSLVTSFDILTSVGFKSVQIIFWILKDHCDKLQKENITQLTNKCIDLVKKMINIREIGCELSHPDVDFIEELLVDSVLKLVHLMSEKTFKPMFNMLVDEANIQKKNIITFFKIMESTSYSLKSLFNMYGKMLIPLMTKTLKTSGPVAEKCFQSVFKTIANCHVNDINHSFAGRASEELHQTLVDTTERLSESFSSERCFIDCIVQVAQSIKDVDILKSFYEKILKKLEHKNSKVKILTLKTVKGICDSLENANDAFLQDACPYVAELVEDDDEVVVKHSNDLMEGPLRILFENQFS